MPFPFYNSCERLKFKFNSKSDPEVISAKGILTTIGLIAVAWPIALMIGHMILEQSFTFQSSISDYYHSGMDKIFTGGLFVIGASMLAYKGYYKVDGKIGRFAGVLAFLVALFPTDRLAQDLPFIDIGPFTSSLCGAIHYLSALLLFMTLAYFCTVIFTLGSRDKTNAQYKACGYVIIMCMLGMILDLIFFGEKGSPKNTGSFSLFLFLEILALLAFGIAWIIKGNYKEMIRESGVPDGYKENLLLEYTANCKGKPSYEELRFTTKDECPSKNNNSSS